MKMETEINSGIKKQRYRKSKKSSFKKKQVAALSNSPHELTGTDAPDRTYVEVVQARQKRLEKNRTRHSTIVQKRRGRLERERAEMDEALRTNAAAKLWSLYCSWAGARLDPTNAPVAWTNEQISSACTSTNRSLRDIVVETAGESYRSKVETSIPTVSALAVASSALSASHLSSSMYDGEPVGKLFGKKFKVDAQREALLERKRILTAVGTLKRVRVLCDSGHLTLEHTRVLIIDCGRDPNHRNCLLEIPVQRDDLFSLIHQHCREAIAKGNMKIVLHIPSESEEKVPEVTDVPEK